MDAMSSLMSSFGDNPLKGVQAISGILGTGGNIFSDIQRNNVLQQQMNLTRKYANLTPAQITKGIAGLEQPLSSGLTSSVGNLVSGTLAERGLSESPGILAQSLAQGLGPYQLQEQQMATDAFFKQLGLPISSRPSPFGPFPSTTNTSAIWQNLMASRYGTPTGSLPGGAGQPDWSAIIPAMNMQPPNPATSGLNFTDPFAGDISGGIPA